MKFRLAPTTKHQSRRWQLAARACCVSRPYTTNAMRVEANLFGVKRTMVEFGSVDAGNGTVMQAMGEFRLSDVTKPAVQLPTGSRVVDEPALWITNGTGARTQAQRPATQPTDDYREKTQPEQPKSHSGYRHETSIDQLTNRIIGQRFHALPPSRGGVAS